MAGLYNAGKEVAKVFAENTPRTNPKNPEKANGLATETPAAPEAANAFEGDAPAATDEAKSLDEDEAAIANQDEAVKSLDGDAPANPEVPAHGLATAGKWRKPKYRGGRRRPV